MPTERRTSPWTMNAFERGARSILNGLGNLYEIPIRSLPGFAAAQSDKN